MGIRPDGKLFVKQSNNINMKKVFVFDVEATHLYGIGFAVGAVVLQLDRYDITVIDKFGLMSIENLHKASDWVKLNVIPHLVSGHVIEKCETDKELRDRFFEFYKKHAADCEIWSDCNYPVETNFLAQVAMDDLKEREFAMPYPLKDISTICGIEQSRSQFYIAVCPDPVVLFTEHHPVHDAMASGYYLLHQLYAKDTAKTNRF